MHAGIQIKVLLTFAGISLLLATIAGAVGSHALVLDEQARQSFTTAVEFQFFHGLGVIALAALGLRGGGGRLLCAAAWLLVLGTLLFCGSIYARTFGAPPGVIALAPYGGVSFMLGWLLFAASVWLPQENRTSR